MPAHTHLLQILSDNSISLLTHNLQKDNRVVKFRWGLLFSGYRQKSFYWEIVLMIRKSILIMINEILHDLSEEEKYLYLSLLISFFLFNHISSRPYGSRILNRMESISLLLLWIRIWFTVYVRFLENKAAASGKEFNGEVFEFSFPIIFVISLLLGEISFIFWCIKSYVRFFLAEIGLKSKLKSCQSHLTSKCRICRRKALSSKKTVTAQGLNLGREANSDISGKSKSTELPLRVEYSNPLTQQQNRQRFSNKSSVTHTSIA